MACVTATSPNGNAVDVNDSRKGALLGPCVTKYTMLEECLGEHDRKWAECQREAIAFRACMAARRQAATTAVAAVASAGVKHNSKPG